MMYRELFSQVVVSALLASGADAALYNKVLHTKYGDVVGYPAFNSSPAGNLTNWKNIAVFKGIPFAATTAGQNRWRQPQPAEPWNTTLYASTFGPACPASVSNSGGGGGGTGSGNGTSGSNSTGTSGSAGGGGGSTTTYVISEDCLSLNIWTAAEKTDAKLPVVMWSYPAESTSQDALFNGGGMADKGVVFVNYNYRTGSFGWMGHPELSEEFEALTGHNVSGNWGVYDQFAALKWIRNNIADFGGNPDHITVMGQSAGSAATYHILNSPLTKGEIVGAIIESGVRDPHDPLLPTLAEGYVSLDFNVAQGPKFLASLNVTTIAEARALPYADLVSSLSTFGSTSEWTWNPTLDYYALPNTYEQILKTGPANQVPVITGNTRDESGADYGLNITVATYLSDLNSTYNGTWIEKFHDLYPANDSVTASGAENSQFTDRSKVGTWLWSQLWKQGSSKPIFNYIWDHAPPGEDRGAYHESEINYVLNNLYDTDLPWVAADYQIAETMNSYWVNFIKHGNPNGAGLVKWPAVGDQATVQRVGNAFKHVPAADAAKVKLFEDWFATLVAY